MKFLPFAGCLAVLAALSPFARPGVVTPAVQDAFSFLPADSVHLQGHLGDELALCLRNRIMAQDVPEIIEPFRVRTDKTEWRSEFWGKWITSAIQAYQNHPDAALRAKIEDAVQKLIQTQSPDGYIGAYSPENHLQRWDVWGRKYTLLGLLAWYDASGDKECLSAATRLADHLLTEAGPGKGNLFKNDMWSGMATSSVLEPMVLLYRRTGDRRYLDFCEWLVGEWSQPYGPDIERKALADIPVFKMFPGPTAVIKTYGDNGHSKAYEMMSCFEGLVELYRVTGKAEHRDAALKVYANIQKSEITVIGSGSDWERWCDGAARQTQTWQKGMETCVTATWIKFSAQLLRLTGDPKYADAIELAAYNALLGAQSPDGAWWCHYVNLTGAKEGAAGQCGLNENCCVANGPRGLTLLPKLAVMEGSEGPVINLYGKLNATTALADGNRVTIAMDSAYPAEGHVTCSVTPEYPQTFALLLRIPAWSDGTRVRVNGKPVEGIQAGQYARINRSWQAGDLVTVDFNLSTRVIPAPGAPRFFALARGPIILARDVRTGGDIDAPLNVKPSALPELAEAHHPQSWMAFNLVGQDGNPIPLCDFASAGNTWKADSRYRVWFEAK